MHVVGAGSISPRLGDDEIIGGSLAWFGGSGLGRIAGDCAEIDDPGSRWRNVRAAQGGLDMGTSSLSKRHPPNKEPATLASRRLSSERKRGTPARVSPPLIAKL